MNYYKILLVGDSNVGKCFGENTNVLMYNETVKNVKDIELFDILMGDDHTPRTVISITYGIGNLFLIKQEKGNDYVVNVDHILCLIIDSKKVQFSIDDIIDANLDITKLKGYKIINKEIVVYNIQIIQIKNGKYYGFSFKEYSKKFLLEDMTVVHNSNLLLKYIDDEFQESHISTIGVDFKSKVIGLSKIQIWDTAGQERFRTITSSYYRGVHGVIIIFDLNNKKSFLHVKSWLEELEKYIDKDICIILVGNKLDLKREIDYEEAETFAIKNGVDYIETSAKENINVSLIFELMVRNIKLKKFPVKMHESIIIKEQTEVENFKCC